MICYKDAYSTQKSAAKIRGIAWLLTFEEWLEIWEQSGNLHLRGPKIGQYCMARYGDVGPYAVGNVRIILSSENHIEAAPRMRGIPKTEEHKEKHSIVMSGRKHIKEHNEKIGRALLGKPCSSIRKANITIKAKQRAKRCVYFMNCPSFFVLRPVHTGSCGF